MSLANTKHSANMTEREQRLDQPQSQLDQVLHQRGLGGLDVLVRHAASPARFGASAGDGSVEAGAAGAKSAFVTGGNSSGKGTSIEGAGRSGGSVYGSWFAMRRRLVMQPATCAGSLGRDHAARCRVLGLVHRLL